MASVLLVAISGCSSQRISEPKRTATEQLLISTAADRALADINFSSIAGKKVYLDTTYFESEDKEYVIGSIRDRMFASGVLVVNSMDSADVIVEARSGALSIDGSESLTGLPSMPIPIPFAGMTQSPEVALLKSQNQDAIAKLFLLAYNKESRGHIYSSDALIGKAYNTYYQVLGIIKFRRTDIPEKRMFRPRE